MIKTKQMWWLMILSYCAGQSLLDHIKHQTNQSLSLLLLCWISIQHIIILIMKRTSGLVLSSFQFSNANFCVLKHSKLMLKTYFSANLFCVVNSLELIILNSSVVLDMQFLKCWIMQFRLVWFDLTGSTAGIS